MPKWIVLVNGSEKAFTLVELLVVVFIISVLAALLLPTLEQSLEQSRRVSCLSNLKQLYVGAALYAGDFGDAAPVWTGPGNIYSNTMSLANNYCRNYQGAGYHTALYVMISDTRHLDALLFRCPSMDYNLDVSGSSALAFFHYDYRYNTSYICNRAGDIPPYPTQGAFARSDRLKTAIFAESSNYRSPALDHLNFYLRTNLSASPQQFRWAHEDGGNAVTHSGEARWLPNCFKNKSASKAGFWPTCGSDTYMGDREGPNAALTAY